MGGWEAWESECQGHGEGLLPGREGLAGRPCIEIVGWLLFIYNTCFLSAQILGVAIRFGKFSVKENKQLEKNVQEFLSLTGIETADKLLHTDRYPEEKAAITDLKRRFAFRLHIGERRGSGDGRPRRASGTAPACRLLPRLAALPAACVLGL